MKQNRKRTSWLTEMLVVKVVRVVKNKKNGSVFRRQMTKHNTPTSATHRNKFSIVTLCFYRRKIYDGGIYIFILSQFICVYNDDKSMTKFLQTEARGGRDARSNTMPTTSLSAHSSSAVVAIDVGLLIFLSIRNGNNGLLCANDDCMN